MSQFLRKSRKINYFHSKCKKYLRFDFNYRCAYCGQHEFENIASYNFFQIDHFRPKKKFSHLSDIDDYNNLYYSCSICNGRSGKSDNWDENLLNPCMVNIFGDEHHIKITPDLITFKLISNSPEGQIFINTIKLDNRKHREIRRERHARNISLNTERALLEEMMKDLEAVFECEKNANMMSYLKQKHSEIEYRLIGPYYKSQVFDEEEIILAERLRDIDTGITLSKIYDENELDYILEYGQYSTKCYVEYVEKCVFRNGRKTINVFGDNVTIWNQEMGKVICLLVNKTDGTIYYSNPPQSGNVLTFNSADVITKDTYSILFGESLNLAELQAAVALNSSKKC
ncbi:HNH endonuclease [Paenibacillus agaridevorans]|uniref:HNH endonuclease n=1 Tax=Paenibacillus agaridevorans TaxID=171404 RepID=UPI001BE48BF1|nr:HNH endonuclease [Paenibacillus agaridevorans]